MKNALEKGIVMTEVNFRKYCVLWGDPANRDLDDEYFNEKKNRLWF